MASPENKKKCPVGRDASCPVATPSLVATPSSSGDIALAKSAAVPNEYHMSNADRGYAVIINNKKFKELPERKGTDVDCNAMKTLLLTLGFKDEHIKVVNDASADEMKDVMKEASQEDFTNCDCFVGVVMSHGRKDGDICGYDEPVSVEELTACFKGKKCHKSLIGKPKLFFFQACRGLAEDEAVETVSTDALLDDEDDVDLQIPAEADFLLSFSVVPGYLAWINEGCGSWYIQSIVKVFNEKWKEDDLVSMLTEVNKTVAVDYDLNGTKQMPCFSSRLLKKIYFAIRDVC